MRSRIKLHRSSLGSAGMILALTACGGPAKSASSPAQSANAPSVPASAGSISQCTPDAVAYQPQPASNTEVHLPPVPDLPKRPIKVGDAFTVWGASYFLRSRVHRTEVSGARITIEGYVVKTNLSDAPRCAVHPTGHADPESCRAPIPTFWIGDTANASQETSIQVMGWASNYAQIFDAIRVFDSAKGDVDYTDAFWASTYRIRCRLSARKCA